MTSHVWLRAITVMASVLALSAFPSRAQLYMSAESMGDERLFFVTEDGTLEDVTVAGEAQRIGDMDTDVRGRVLAIANVPRLPHLVRWDLVAGTEEVLTSLTYYHASVAALLDGGSLCTDGELGVKRLSASGDVTWAWENPTRDDRFRFQGLQVDAFGGEGGVAYVGRRPNLFEAEPTDVLRLSMDTGEVEELVRLPFQAHHFALVDDVLVIPEYAAGAESATALVDVQTGTLDVEDSDEVATEDVTVSHGRAYRVARRERIDVWEPDVRAWIPWVHPAVDVVRSLAPAESLIDRELDCPKENHGLYVSCVARRTQRLVRNGVLTREQRQELLRIAAQSDIGKRQRPSR